MLKLRLRMEDVAEKLFGRFLPQVEVQANDCQPWELKGCCGYLNLEHSYFTRVCPPGQGPPTMCTGICAI
jgi:hypothetical protein